MGLFDDDQVRLDLLRQRAFNLRWATLDSDVIPLTAADPDFPIAPEIRDAVSEYVQGGVLSYGPAEGLPHFREVVAQTMRDRRGMRCTSSEVLAAPSAAAAMFVVAKYALLPGDEAIVFDPVDFLFEQSVLAAGGVVKRCPIDPETREIDFDRLGALIGPRTRMIGVCNPHNPFGRVLTRDELVRLGSLAVRHDLWLMSDEIWSDIVYDGREFISLASLDDSIAARTISVYGFSKTFGLAGFRVGFIVAPDAPTFEQILAVSKAPTTAFGVSTVSQIAGAAAYEHAWYWADAFVQHLTANRDMAVARLNALPGVRCRSPEGTYLLFPNIVETGMSAAEVHGRLLNDARVAVVPGEPRWFGPGAAGHVRLSIATSHGILDEALTRIEATLG